MIRVLSNYGRLIATFVIGIVIVRIMAEIGPDAALIYLLLISSTGIAAMFKFALQNALVPALGLSIDGSGEHDFQKVYWTSFVLGVGAGLLSVVLFAGFWLVSDQLNFGALSQTTIAIALLGTAVQTFASSVGIVFLNLLLVERRLVAYNIMLVLDRALILVAATVIIVLPPATSVDDKLQLFYALVGGLTIVLQLGIYVLAVRGEPHLRLRRAPLVRQTTAWISAFIGWNAVVVIAFALFTRWPPLVVNWSLGELMTLTLSIVLLLIGYQRQLSMGLVVGLDAMVARLMGTENDGEASSLILRWTYILTVFATFSCALIGLFVETILALWFGDSLSESGWVPAMSADLFRIMSFGIAASILSEGWMKFLSGRGEVRAFAPPLLIAGIINIVGVIIASTLLEGQSALMAIALVFSGSFLVVNLGFVAVQTARRANVRLSAFYAVIAGPALIAACAAAPALFLHNGGWTMTNAAVALCILGVCALAALLTMPRFLARLSPA